MNTKNLTTFKTIIETGSFQKAADKLHFTQSTVTFQIKQLEEELSLKLFEKIGRHMELTQAGKDILPQIDIILQGEAKIRSYGKSMSEISGTLKLAIPDSILIYNMQTFIRTFRHEAPNVQLIIDSLQSEDVNQAILEGRADIAINCDRDFYPDTVVHEKLGTYTTVFVAAPFVNPELLDFTTPHQQKPFSLICNEPNAYYQTAMNKYLSSKDISMNPYMKVQSIEAVKKCVMNNLGLAIVPYYSVTEELKKGALIRIKTDLDNITFNSVCLYNKNKWLSPQMELALKLIKSTVPA